MANETKQRTLDSFLAEDKEPVGSFKPSCWYSKTGDSIFCFHSGEMNRAEHINNLITVFRAEKSREIVGVQIKGIHAFADHSSFQLKHGGEVNIGALLEASFTSPMAYQKRPSFFSKIFGLRPTTVPDVDRQVLIQIQELFGKKSVKLSA